MALCGGACTGAVWNIGTACLLAAQRSSRAIFCLDTAFVLIDGTNRAGQIRINERLKDILESVPKEGLLEVLKLR